ncbi:MAG TPA: hypothetical protein VG692_05640 [Gemmatimonadales bacterium]|nr:hypothetical protein [Gemmatimonadales bacterium]
MSDALSRRLLGDGAPDPGCESAFTVLDRYADLVLRGEPVGPEFDAFLTHLANCPACREDTEGLLAALRDA